jgi:hypothetical protein
VPKEETGRKAEEEFQTAIKRTKTQWKPVKMPDRQQCPRCSFLLPKQSSHSVDYIIYHTTDERICEVKHTGQPRFMFSGISEEQRVELDSHHSAWIFLSLGNSRPNSKLPDRRIAFLIPWRVWRQTEHAFNEVGVKSIARDETALSRPKTAVERGMYATHWLKNFQLNWVDGGWEVPRGHLWRIQE